MQKRELRPLSEEEQSQIERLSRSQVESYRVVRRAKIIQLATANQRIKEIAQQVGVREPGM